METPFAHTECIGEDTDAETGIVFHLHLSLVVERKTRVGRNHPVEPKPVGCMGICHDCLMNHLWFGSVAASFSCKRVSS